MPQERPNAKDSKSSKGQTVQKIQFDIIDSLNHLVRAVESSEPRPLTMEEILGKHE